MPHDPNADPVPQWASFFSPDRFELFLDRVRDHFRRRGQSPLVVADEGYVSVPGDSVPTHKLGLSNLAQGCNQCDPAEWDELVARHFDGLRQASVEGEDLRRRVGDFEKVRDQLAVRIGGADSIGNHRDMLVCRDDLPGTVTYLVLDLPTTVQNVRPEDAAKWGLGVDELFAVGLENVYRMDAPEVTRLDADEGSQLVCLTGNHFFVATHALMLERHPQCVGGSGSLVAVPHRHALLTFPVDDLRVVMAVQRLAVMAVGMEREGPGSISPKLYYRYRDGRYLDLPFELGEKNFNFYPPGEFVDVLNELPAPPGRE